MFGLSWSETLLILVVALVVMKPQDIPPIIRSVRGFFRKCKALQQEFSGTFMDIVDQPEFDDLKDLKKEAQTVNKDIGYIVDMEGNLQETYDIKDLMEKKQASETPPPSATTVPSEVKEP